MAREVLPGRLAEEDQRLTNRPKYKAGTEATDGKDAGKGAEIWGGPSG